MVCQWSLLIAVMLRNLITAHFKGGCSWCTELAPAGITADTSRVGRLEAVDPDTGTVIPFFVFVQNREWRCTLGGHPRLSSAASVTGIHCACACVYVCVCVC